MDRKLANRRIAWFSCGTASAVAASISAPDVRAYCDTGSEDSDNRRFMADCESKFSWPPITILRSEDYRVSVRCAPPNGADFDGSVSTIDSGHLGALYGCEAEEAALAG